MIAVDSWEYMQARLSARNGERPDDATWRHLEVMRELSAALDAARGSHLRQWTTGITPEHSVHEIEATLRAHWRALVAEVANWMPGQWRSCVAWCAVLADLPVLQYLARDGRALAWMRSDAVYRDLCVEASGACPAAWIVGPLAPLAAAWAEPDRFLAAWRAEWLRRLPRSSLADTPLLARLVVILDRHFAAFGEADSSNGWSLRRALQAQLTLLLRRAVLDPAAAFVFLALATLDFERLRGELARRAAFPRAPLAS